MVAATRTLNQHPLGLIGGGPVGPGGLRKGRWMALLESLHGCGGSTHLRTGAEGENCSCSPLEKEDCNVIALGRDPLNGSLFPTSQRPSRSPPGLANSPPPRPPRVPLRPSHRRGTGPTLHE